MKKLNIYSYNNLPRNRQGIVSEEGNFIAFYPIDKKTFSQASIKAFIEEFYNLDIASILIEDKLHQFRQDIYNYKDILVDYLKYAIYESYISTPLAVIKVPNIVSEEQEKTLIKLVDINNNDKESLLPIKGKVKIKK